MKPEVSVVLPFFNRIQWCIEAINSVLDQTFREFEIILVDDGSTERLFSLSNFQQDKRVNYFKRPHLGVSAARNFGIEHSQGKYIAFLDSDDLFLPNKLEIQIGLMEKMTGYSMSYSHALLINENGELLKNKWGGYLSGNIYPQMLFIKNSYITTPTVVIKKDVLKHIGGFDIGMNMCEDLDLWRRVARVYHVLHITEPLVKIREKTLPTLNIEDRMRAREKYYKKAFDEDRSIECLLRRPLFAEMFIVYGLLAVKNKKIMFGSALIINALIKYPLESCYEFYVRFFFLFKKIVWLLKLCIKKILRFSLPASIYESIIIFYNKSKLKKH